ncbi:hypothetical protein KR018_010967 [Drosophila ironensis]|nr:hypothetical protein KR018_010967 [Drosophila ironensis]
MSSSRGITFAALAILLASSQASQFSKDESKEDQRTEFNLASTLTGGISSSRHRQGASLNSLYPALAQVGAGGGYTGSAGFTGANDDAHGHEQGGSGARLGPVVFPGLQLPNPGVQIVASQLPNPSVNIGGGQQVPAYPTPGYPEKYLPNPGVQIAATPLPNPGGQQVSAYPLPGFPGQHPPVPYSSEAAYPAYPGGYPYPGTYLPQYPGYPALFPPYGVAPGAAAVSSPNVQRYPAHNPRDPNHWDHHFSMNTEYKEDGVHKGAFGALNNHNAFGYGSGYGGGYNGAFNSPTI